MNTSYSSRSKSRLLKGSIWVTEAYVQYGFKPISIVNYQRSSKYNFYDYEHLSKRNPKC